jgi:hypothetical protein
MYSSRTNQVVDQFATLSQDQQEQYYLQKFGVGAKGMEAVLNTAKSLAEGRQVSANQMKTLLSQLPGADTSYASEFAKAVNGAGMPREYFLEAVTRNSRWDMHDAIRTSNNWNRIHSTEEVTRLLEAKFAQSEKGMAKPVSDTKQFTEKDTDSDAHRLAVRDSITGALKYVTGKRDPRSADESFARSVDTLGSSTDQRTRELIKETFEKRASPNYSPPEPGSLRESLTNVIDNKLADAYEAAETGYITTPDGGMIDADKEVGWN